MASPTPCTLSQARAFSSRYRVIASTQLSTTACGPADEGVGACSNFVETGEPSDRTAATLDVVAPPSVPMYTCPSEWRLLVIETARRSSTGRSSYRRPHADRRAATFRPC